MKPNVVLDLDQTLISAEPTEEYDFAKNREKVKKFKFHNMEGYYVVFERPGLQPFLDYLFDNCTVSVWTAASKDYAMFILEKIILTKPGRTLDYVFCSYHCDISKKIKKGSKDLSLLKDAFNIEDYTADTTFIIDDYDEVYKTQPTNCIYAKAFEFNDSGSENDSFLSSITEKIKKMQTGTSVKPVVEEINREMKVEN